MGCFKTTIKIEYIGENANEKVCWSQSLWSNKLENVEVACAQIVESALKQDFLQQFDKKGDD